MRDRSIDKRLDDIYKMLKSLRKMMQYFLGTYSHYVGKAAEQLTAGIINRIWEMGGCSVGDKYVRPIRLVSRNVRGSNYEIDLIGMDEDGNVWIIETTTYPIFDMSLVDKICRRINRWIEANKKKPSFMLFAYGGIERGLSKILYDRLKSVCSEVIILDKIESRKLIGLTDRLARKNDISNNAETLNG